MRIFRLYPPICLIVLTGIFSCTKKDHVSASAPALTNIASVSLLGIWMAGPYSHSEKRLADRVSGPTITRQIPLNNWEFRKDGSLSIVGMSSANPVTFASLTDNRLVLSMQKTVDTFVVESIANDGIRLTEAKTRDGRTLTETLELYRAHY